MEKNNVRTAKFVVTKQHFASVLRPHSMPSGDERYAIRCPAHVFPECEGRDRDQDELGPMVNVSSKHRPVFVRGDDTNTDRLNWQLLVEQAERWNYPVNFLLLDREITIAGTVWTSRDGTYRGRPFGATHHASLLAVKVVGDFTRDEGLAGHILDVKGWLDDEDTVR